MIHLRAGHLNVTYENGFLRYIRSGNAEVVRMIYFAWRDENWGTLAASIEDENIVSENNTFRIQYTRLHSKNNSTIFQWNVSIAGHDDGTIEFEIHGKAHEPILKNRAGFCVLHPILEAAGQPAEISHADGSVSKSNFPDLISPDNPFRNIRSMRWKSGGLWYTLVFEGDIFETEDQRNWTDASFKTFCTPLDLPFPVQLKKGEPVRQRIVFKAESIAQVPVSDEKIYLSKGEKKIPLPSLGIGASSIKELLSKESADLLKQLTLSHYAVDVAPSSPTWVQSFSLDSVNASAIGLPLSVTLHLSQDYKNEIEAFTQLCLQNRLQIKQVLLIGIDALSTPQHVIDEGLNIRSKLKQVKLGAGTKYNFTEFNRNRFDGKNLDVVSFSIHPQEHAFDDLSLIETLEAQSAVIRSAKTIYPNTLIHVSPVTLRKRFNPYAATPEGRIISEDKREDPRQPLPFCAVWTLGSICHLAQAGAASITYFQTEGNQGVISRDPKPFPVFEALKMISSQKTMISVRSSHPLKVEATAFDHNGLLLWNYTGAEQTVYFQDQVVQLAPYGIKFLAAFVH